MLFTGGGGAGNEALWRNLNENYEVHFGDANIDNIDLSIPQHNRHTIPYGTSMNFVDKLLNLCNRLEIDLLVPGVDEELLVFAQYVKKFLPTKILLPNKNFVKTMLNKFDMIKHLQSKNIEVPKTYLLSYSNYHLSMPCISKPIYGRGSVNIFYLNNSNDVTKLKENLVDNLDNYIIQEKIEGSEYTVQMICNENKVLRAIIPVKIFYKRGITIRAVIDNNSTVIKTCKAIHDAFPTQGVYNIQLILTSKNLAMPFEINPRISTTFCLALHAITDDPFDLYYSNTSLDNPLVEVKDGITISRHWYNYIK